MRKEGIAPDVITYSNLFKGDIKESADELLKWYLAEPNHPDTAISVAIISYRRQGATREAMQLALSYAHLPEARRFMREYFENCNSYFKSLADADSQHPNANYALGVLFWDVGKFREAQSYLESALKLATAESRKTVIKDWLRQIQASKPK